MKKEKNTHITWHSSSVPQAELEKRNGHKGAVIWLTGLSGSGKSTVACKIQSLLFERGVQTFILDGDNIRHGLNQDLGFSPEDREENIRRIGEVAKLFREAGFLVITSFISPYRKDRDKVRSLLSKGDFIEMFIKASLETCEKRDPKDLYKKARSGEVGEFTGITAPYEEPKSPEITLDTEKINASECAKIFIKWLEDNRYIKAKN